MFSRSRVCILAIGIILPALFFVSSAHAVSPADYGLVEGDLISASGSSDPDIYIVNQYGYKRLFLNPTIFNFYGHLKWSNVRSVSSTTRDAFPTSGLFRNCEANDPKVYGVEVITEDGGALHWVNVTGEQAVAQDPDFFKKVFCINSAEFNWYAKSTDYTAVSQVPEYSRTVAPAQELSFTWTKESGQRIAGGIPFAQKLSDGRVRLYFCGPGGILSAISSDGLNFTQESGARIGSRAGNEAVVCDPTLVTLPDGRVRMYYKGANSASGGPGQAIHKIYSAISSDGLAFTREGLRIDSEQTDDRGWASVPEAFRLSDGRVRLYYVSDSVVSGHGIVSAISSDGFTFTKEDTKLTGYVDPSITTLPDGRYLLLAPSMAGGGIYRFVSNDGIHFEDPQIVLAESGAIDPAIVMLDEQSYRVYYWRLSDSPVIIYSLMGLLQ